MYNNVDLLCYYNILILMDEFKKFYLVDLFFIFINFVYDICVNIG